MKSRCLLIGNKDQYHRPWGYYIHRAIYEVYVGEIPKGHVIRHLCHNKNCVNPAHLATGTQYDNVMDSVRDGRWCIGERRPETHLTENDVREIRRLCRTDMRKREIAKMFNVVPSTISNIVSGYSWKHLK